YRFACAKVPKDFAGQHAAFLGIDLPADDHPTEYVHEQIEIEILPTNRCRQVGDVPAKQLIGRVGTYRAWLAAGAGWSFTAPVGELFLFAQHPVKRRFRGDVAALVGQA